MRRILKRVVTHLVATSIMLGLGIGLLIWNLAEHHYLSFSGVLVFIVLGSARRVSPNCSGRLEAYVAYA
jgi:hypothetical protein